jgi:hypothetical protein
MQAVTIITVGVRVGVGLHCPSRRLSPGVLQIHISSPILLPLVSSKVSNVGASLLIHESPHNVWLNSEARENTVASAGLGFDLG